MTARRTLALFVAVALAAAACGDDAATTDDTADDGPVTLTLMTHDSFDVGEDVLATFEEAHGIAVELLRAGDAGSTVNQAILTQEDPLADVLFGVDNTFLTRALDEDLFVPYEAEGLAAVPEELRLDPAHRVTPVDYGDVCLNYDRTFFGEAGPPPPSSLDDLLEPAYADLTVVEDAAASSPGLAFLLATIARYGEEGWQPYWRDLRENGVRVAADWEAAYYGDFTVGGGGDRPIVVSYASSPPADVVFAEEEKDEPAIGVVEDGCFRQVELAGILAGTDHEEEARELVDFLLSEPFQEDVPLRMFVFPARADVALPDVFERWAATPEDPLTLDPETIGARRDEWIDEWTEIVVR